MSLNLHAPRRTRQPGTPIPASFDDFDRLGKISAEDLIEPGFRNLLLRRKADFLTSPAAAEGRVWNPRRDPETVIGTVMSSHEVNQALETGNTDLLIATSVVAFSNEKVVFLTDDSSFGLNVLPSGFTSTSFKLPMQVASRPSVPNGSISTADELIDVFYPHAHQLDTIDELVAYINDGDLPARTHRDEALFDGMPEYRSVSDDYIFADYSGPDKDDPLNPPAHVDFHFCDHSFVERGSAVLVRGVGKRAIHVAIALPYISGYDSVITDTQLAYKAALTANRYGWRRVVVALDDYFGCDARLFNVDQYKVQNLKNGHQGKFLHQIKRERSI